MEIRQLRQFVVVAEELNFRRAAVRLHMSQPPLSVAMRNLETEVGTVLLDRSRHHVRLTAAGAAFLRDAQRALLHLQLGTERARRAEQGMDGALRLSFVPSAALDVLPAILKRFRRDCPTVQLQLTADTTTRQVEALQKADVELALVVAPVADSRTLRLTRLVDRRFVLAVPAEHALARRRTVRIKELAAESFIAFPASEGPGFANALLNACQNAGFFPNVVHQAAQMQTILTLVSGGLGIALVPEAMRVLHLPDVVFVGLAEGRSPPTYSLSFAHTADNDNPALEAFVATARRVVPR
ncbi:MAG: LysR family transcriptional regulator [Lautropia sp.]